MRMIIAGLSVLICALPAAGQVLLPAEGASLNRTQFRFEWLPVSDAISYELVVVEDDGTRDPFAGATPVVELELEPIPTRTIVTTGLEFGKSYAWRVRGIDRAPLKWGATHRFSTIAQPESGFPEIVTSGGEGQLEPGLTMFGVDGNAYAVRADGTPVWFLPPPEGITGVGDLRLLPNGRVLMAASGASGGRAAETTLSGEITWISPDDPDLSVHHEAFPMPNGNIMTLVHVFEDLEFEGEIETWMGDRIVEFDRGTNEIVWEWNTFDHFSTEDYDPAVMQSDISEGILDWTHSNAVLYNQSDNSVYLSVRHLSRITRIDYDTGEIVYNMGFEKPYMPSGDVDFGDNLFSFQHAPQLLPNGNMMVYDNGNRRDHMAPGDGEGISKAIELAFTGEPVPTSASIVWEFICPEFTPLVGDADRLPGGNTLVVAGPANKIYEVAPDESILWSLETIDTGLIYRAERIGSLYPVRGLDLTGDGNVGVSDILVLLGAWGECPQGVYCPPDYDNSGDVTILDLLTMIGNWS